MAAIEIGSVKPVLLLEQLHSLTVQSQSLSCPVEARENRNQQRQSPDDVFGISPPSGRYELLFEIGPCRAQFAVGVMEKAADGQCDLKGVILPKRPELLHYFVQHR